MHTTRKLLSLMFAAALALGTAPFGPVMAYANEAEEALVAESERNETELLASDDSDVEAARRAVEQAEQRLASLKAQWDSGSIGFFESRGSTAAIDAIKNCTYASYTHIGDENDATEIVNMWNSLELIGVGNDLRTSVGLGVLGVSDLMMAYAQADANFSDKNIGHAAQFAVWENLAWNYGTDPFEQWYDDEKAIFDAAYTARTGSTNVPTGADAYNWYQNNPDVRYSGQVGHYINVITPQLYVTGFGIVTRGSTNGWMTFSQVAFVYGGDDPSSRVYSLYDYMVAFDEYCTNLDNAITQAESDLTVAQQRLEAILAQNLNLADATISPIDRQAYTGSAVTPKPAVTIYGLTLTEGNDYTLSYQNNVNKGTASVTITGQGRVKGTRTLDFEIVTEFEMYRLYNPNSGEHFYTASESERDTVVAAGWKAEGIGWVAPSTGDPVYRLYNPNAGDHHYTLDKSEHDSLVRLGWHDEGIGWYSDTSKAVPLHREYNPNAQTGTHNYTTSKSEHDSLVRLGWHDEGIAWYALRAAR